MKVLVLQASALHLGFVGCYGNLWIDTPNLDRLAAEGVVFDQHHADTPDAAGPDRTAWTGRYRFPLPGAEEVQAGEESPSLARLLEAEGKVAFVGIDAGRPDEGEADAELRWQRTREETEAALDRLAGREDWLLWVDLPTLAPPWQVPEEFLARYFPEEADEDEEPLEPWPDPPPGPLDRADDLALERLQDTYAAAVTYLDAQLGELWEVLRERGLADQVLVCFTADRGFPLGEHGVLGAGDSAPHDELIHLPLIIRLPGGGEAGRRVLALTQPVDLLPTLLEAFGVPVPPAAHGQSLWPLIRGEKEQVRAYACTGVRLGEAVAWALRTPEWGFLLTPASPAGPPRGPELYVKPDDRWEVNNLVQHHLELAEHLEAVLRGFVEATRRPGPLSPPELRDIEAELAAATAGAETPEGVGGPEGTS